VRETRAAARTGAAIVTALTQAYQPAPRITRPTGYKKGNWDQHSRGVRVELEILKYDKLHTVRGTIASLTMNGYRNVLIDGELTTRPFRPNFLRVLPDQESKQQESDDDDGEPRESDDDVRVESSSSSSKRKKKKNGEASSSENNNGRLRTSPRGRLTQEEDDDADDDHAAEAFAAVAASSSVMPFV